jgi:hypothetical protein
VIPGLSVRRERGENATKTVRQEGVSWYRTQTGPASARPQSWCSARPPRLERTEDEWDSAHRRSTVPVQAEILSDFRYSEFKEPILELFRCTERLHVYVSGLFSLE